jgi:acyl-CoA thioesterase I
VTVRIRPGDTVVFIGDSITDCGRDRADPDSLGDGYAALAAAAFTAAHPGAAVRFANRGIGGNCAVDLRGRWRRDCLDLEPDVVSILVGINEVSRRFDRDDFTPDSVFEEHCRHILEQAADHGAQLIVMEPFLLPVDEEQMRWRAEFEGKLAVVRGLARKFDATLIATSDLMTREAAAAGGPSAIAGDGIHPSPAGHAVLAKAWLAQIGPLDD